MPAVALDDGFHWLAWPETGAPTMGQWSPDLWRWVVTFWGEMVAPENMAHLDYLGVAHPPSSLLPHAREPLYHPSLDEPPAEGPGYMTTKKPLSLTASPYAVFNMLDHSEDRETLSRSIEQFCQMIPDPEAAALWRRDLRTLLDQQQKKSRRPRICDISRACAG